MKLYNKIFLLNPNLSKYINFLVRYFAMLTDYILSSLLYNFSELLIFEVGKVIDRVWIALQYIHNWCCYLVARHLIKALLMSNKVARGKKREGKNSTIARRNSLARGCKMRVNTMDAENNKAYNACKWCDIL